MILNLSSISRSKYPSGQQTSLFLKLLSDLTEIFRASCNTQYVTLRLVDLVRSYFLCERRLAEDSTKCEKAIKQLITVLQQNYTSFRFVISFLGCFRGEDMEEEENNWCKLCQTLVRQVNESNSQNMDDVTAKFYTDSSHSQLYFSNVPSWQSQIDQFPIFSPIFC